MRLTEDQVLVRVRSVTIERLRGWVARGWVAPVRGEAGDEYTDIDVARVDLIRQLRDDLSVDPDAVAMLLSMLDQVYTLRRELRCLMRALEAQPPEVRQQVLSAVRKIREPEPSEG